MNSKQKQFSDEMNLLRIGVDYWKVRPETATSDGAALRARAMALPEPSPVARSTLDGMLSQDSRVRRRFRSESICYAYEDTPADVSIASGFYIDALMKTDAKDIVWKWNLRATTLDVSLRKEISEEAFRSREKMDIHWRYLCHLNRLNDYAPALKDMTEVDDQARYWLKPKTRTYAYGPGFELKFAETLPKLVPLHSVSTGLSYRAFVLNRTLWAKTGSTLLHTATVHTHLAGPDGIESNMVTTKWLTAWTLSDDELWTVATNNSRALSKMIQKREAGKVRAVISGDFVNYLRMSYISYAVLDEMFAGWNVSPIFMNTTQQNVMWDDIATFDGVRMPIDQSSFDQMQSKDTVMSVFKFLVGILFTHVSGAAVTDLQRVGMQLLASIEAGVVRLSTDEMLPWMNGLLSGWRWTALIGTLISLVTFNMAVGLAREYMDVAVSKAYFQGDDIAAEFGTTNSAAAVYLCFLSFGLEVNPMKFIISNTMHDEFLRRSIRPMIITGYPARSVLGILWHNPINDEEEIKAGVLASTFDRWWLFKDRLGIPVESLPFMADMCRATGLSRRDVTAWLSTPSTYGGGGYKVKPKGSGLGFYEPVTDGRFSAEGMVGVKAMEAMFPADWASFAKTTLRARPWRRIPGGIKRAFGDVNWPRKASTIFDAQVIFGRRNRRYADEHNVPWYLSYKDMRRPMNQRGVQERKAINWDKPTASVVATNEPRSVPSLRAYADVGPTVLGVVDDPVMYAVDPQPCVTMFKQWSHRLRTDAYLGRLKLKAPRISGYSVARAAYVVDKLSGCIVNKLYAAQNPGYAYWMSLQWLAEAAFLVAAELDACVVLE